MKLELRKPSFVLLGAWNPAIFQSGWIARYVRGFPEGQNVNAIELIAIENNIPQKILYIDNIGVSANNQRVDIFLNSNDAKDIQAAEESVKNIAQTLSHTPLGPFGINFKFILDEPDPNLFDLLKPKDKIDQHYKIIKQNLITSIYIDDQTTLNFSRESSQGKVAFEFNYHHNQIRPNELAQHVPNKYGEYMKNSLNILSELYDIETEDIEYLHHDFNNQQ